jgi:HAD superfamily hydrolase (TIGR01490 family)
MSKIAVFDFDGTITKSDSLLHFIRHSRGIFSLLSGFILFSPLIILMKFGVLPNWKIKEILFGYYYKGLEIATFDYWGITFKDHLNNNIRNGVKQKIHDLKLEGFMIVIISASMENWIKPWAEDNGVDIVMGTKAEVEEDKLTGRFSTKNCYGAEKVKRLLEKFPEREKYYLCAFGDSKGDRELLAFADDAYYKVF